MKPVKYLDYPMRNTFLSGFELYFCLETRAKLETLPSKWIILANLIYITLPWKESRLHKCTPPFHVKLSRPGCALTLTCFPTLSGSSEINSVSNLLSKPGNNELPPVKTMLLSSLDLYFSSHRIKDSCRSSWIPLKRKKNHLKLC